MSTLRTNSITIRGRSFTVSELDAKAMRDVRKVMAKEPHRLDIYVASLGSVEPKYTEQELGDEPNIFCKRLSAEIMRLTNEDPDDPKPQAPELSDA